jgi:hypothetical protein
MIPGGAEKFDRPNISIFLKRRKKFPARKTISAGNSSSKLAGCAGRVKTMF